MGWTSARPGEGDMYLRSKTGKLTSMDLTMCSEQDYHGNSSSPALLTCLTTAPDHRDQQTPGGSFSSIIGMQRINFLSYWVPSIRTQARS